MFNLNTVKFGVEIECFGLYEQTAIAQAIENLSNCKCNTSSTAYSHCDSTTSWKVTSDASIHANTLDQTTMEIVSPILIGQTGFDQLTSVINLLNSFNFEVNDSCGLHVHIDASSFTIKSWKNLIATYARFQQTINTFLDPTRYNSIFAQSHTPSDLYNLNDNPDATIDDLVMTVYTRYKALNTQSYTRHGTVEFRQHEATLNLETITNWVTFLACLVYDADNRKTQAKMPESSYITKSDDFMNLFDRLCSPVIGLSKDVRTFYVGKRSHIKSALLKIEKQNALLLAQQLSTITNLETALNAPDSPYDELETALNAVV